MNVEQALRDGLAKINSGHLANEAQVKQAVILPILRALGWDDSDPNEFVPELSVELENAKGAVDYALHSKSPKRQPLVFIEAKRLGNVDTVGEEQLFRYANNKGVPFLVLTDGNVWNYYLAMAVGEPPERIVYRAELKQEERLSEFAGYFQRYLTKDRVLSGRAWQDAEVDRKNRAYSEAAREAIPDCWHVLLEMPDQDVVNLLADAVETQHGVRPELDDVEEFLRRQVTSQPQTDSKGAKSTKLSPSSISGVSTGKGHMQEQGQQTAIEAGSDTQSSSNIVGFELDGKQQECGYLTRTLAEILKEFQRRNSGFMERYSARTVGRTRRLVAENRDDLYDRPHLRGYSIDLENGWWVGTNLSRASIRSNIQIACEVADVGFGTQLKLLEK